MGARAQNNFGVAIPSLVAIMRWTKALPGNTIFVWPKSPASIKSALLPRRNGLFCEARAGGVWWVSFRRQSVLTGTTRNILDNKSQILKISKSLGFVGVSRISNSAPAKRSTA